MGANKSVYSTPIASPVKENCLEEEKGNERSAENKVEQQGSTSWNMDFEPMEVDNVGDTSNGKINQETKQIAIDVSYFKHELSKEEKSLLDLCDEWEGKLATSFSNIAAEDTEMCDREFPTNITTNEEIAGEIRATIGKAKIIMSKKGRFQQFQDLIRNCEFGYGEKETTYMDLQGFWDMIYFQVKDINKSFSELSNLASNGWNKTEEGPNKKAKCSSSKGSQKVSITSKKIASLTDKKPSAGIREMMAAKRKEMAFAQKEKLSQPNNVPLVLISSSPLSSEAPFISTPGSPTKTPGKNPSLLGGKLFDGGFFSIESPVSRQRLVGLCDKLQNSRTESISAPSSTTTTPVKGVNKSLYHTVLGNSEAKVLKNDNQNKIFSPLAIVKVNSAIRRSMSHTGERNSPYKILRTRTVSKLSHAK